MKSMKYCYQMPWLSDYSQCLLDLAANPNHLLPKGAFYLKSETNAGQILELQQRRGNVLNAMAKKEGSNQESVGRGKGQVYKGRFETLQPGE